MRIFLGLLAAVAILLANRRFFRSESVGYDVGALFLLLIGIQLLITAALIHQSQESRTPKSPTSADKHETEASGSLGKQ
jgi:hypothetical protein